MNKALELFQKEHGEEWARMLRSPAGQAALELAREQPQAALDLQANDVLKVMGEIIAARAAGWTGALKFLTRGLFADGPTGRHDIYFQPETNDHLPPEAGGGGDVT